MKINESTTDPAPIPNFLSRSRVAEKLGVSKQKIKVYVNKGMLPAFMIIEQKTRRAVNIGEYHISGAYKALKKGEGQEDYDNYKPEDVEKLLQKKRVAEDQFSKEVEHTI